MEQMVVHFKGGTLGGEVRVMPKTEFYGGKIRVPVTPTTRLRENPTPWGYPLIGYDVDEYHVERQIRPDEVEARWIRPKADENKVRSLENEVSLLKAKLACAEDAMDSLKKLRKYFRKH